VRNGHSIRAIVASFLITFAAAGTAPARATQDGEQGLTLRVGTREAPPFSMKGPDGQWDGLSIRLWEGIAEDLSLEYELVDVADLAGLLRGLEDGSLDGVVAALNVTAARESRFDFTHPFHTSGYGIAIRAEQPVVWIEVLKRLASREFATALSTLAGLLFIAGFLVWLAERRRNDQFGGSVPRGIWEGFWWSAVTMTTVGYGDRYPMSVPGRIIALVWMFTSVVIVSSFTAAIASSLTVGSLDARIRSLDDLGRSRVASVPSSSSAAFLDERGIPWIEHPSLSTAMEALSAADVDAVFYDEPLIRHQILARYRDRIHLVPGTFQRLDYAIGLPDGSRLREPINQSLLRRIATPEWRESLRRYLGS
jgi:polar amino acid transport system substrate-binding protein